MPGQLLASQKSLGQQPSPSVRNRFVASFDNEASEGD
jgi:hypothetical protein